jgi:hypothetical protein
LTALQGVEEAVGMEAVGVFKAIAKALGERKRRKFVEHANAWPTAKGNIVLWQRQPADEEFEAFSKVQLSATLRLPLNGEGYYGLLYSTALTIDEAMNVLNSESKPTQVTVRYNPADPGEMLVSPVEGELPFETWLPVP